LTRNTWTGRFPKNNIITLLDVNRQYNLVESTARDLTFGELLDLAGGSSAISGLKLGYGTSAGLLRLREAIAGQTGVTSDEVVVTQGTALGLFLLASNSAAQETRSLSRHLAFPHPRTH
jgi:DNA-binding transcriptional MocR family regulator